MEITVLMQNKRIRHNAEGLFLNQQSQPCDLGSDTLSGSATIQGSEIFLCIIPRNVCSTIHIFRISLVLNQKPSLDGEAPMSPMLRLALLHTKMWITFVPFYHEIVVK